MSVAMGTALSALTVAQRLAELSSHNIANANTPGYSRQTALLRPSSPIRTTAGLMGTGVTIDGIVSVRDRFLNLRISAQNTGLGNTEILSRTLAELEAIIMPGPDTGLGYAIDEFFNAVNELSTDAQSTVTREALRQSAGALCGVFRTTVSELERVRLDLSGQYDADIEQINSHIEQIAELNGRITEVSQGGYTAGDLVDQRDLRIEELSRLIPVQIITEGNVSNVLFEGRLIVSGTDFMTMASDNSDGRLRLRIPQTTDVFETHTGLLGGTAELYNEIIPGYTDAIDELAASLIREFNAVHATGVGLQNGYSSLTSATELADADANGTVGDEPLVFQSLAFPPTAGTLYVTVTDESTGEMERTAVDYNPAVDSVYDIAARIATVPYMNASVAAGYLTITSWPGYRFDFSNKLLPGGGSIGTSQLTVSGSYAGAIDRSFTFYPMSSGSVGGSDDLPVAVVDNNGNFLGQLEVGSGYTPGTPLEVSDGVKVAFGAGDLQAAQVQTAQGPFALADGDQLTVSIDGQPPETITFSAADFADIANATASEVAQVINNAGVGVAATLVGNAVMLSPAGAGPDSSIQVGGSAAAGLGLTTDTVTTDSLTIDVLGQTDTGGLLATLGVNAFFAGDRAGNIRVSDHVQASTDNIAAAKSSPPGDNANAVQLARVGQRRIANQGSQTLSDFFAALVGRVGVDASYALRSHETQTALVDSLENQRQSIVGVSLEEEMAKLMQNQQAYLAAAKLIETLDQMLEALTRL